MANFSPAARSLTLKAHVAFWGIAGTAAVAYLGLIALGFANSEALPENDLSRGQSREFVGMERAVLQLSADVRAVEGKIAATEESGQALLGRIASLEEKHALLSSSAGAAARIDGEPRAGTRPAPQATSQITTGTILQHVAPPT